ncbi:NUDIX domain-containing protein [Actinomyces sp. 2119]|uniref:8-oxo-dGTP diphosphatase n=1 Tax=Actinomyces lilanjuaniae TaxID=2321394 RepID=A0ABM6Z1D7_9ACTO|nr:MULTISPECIES: NUDIX domain-containing protein [Actinomyces]AYD89065.1 NUDIX domain-containing protein [Actinomyces lilanjuaniae]RJF40493.1 NUDIX domain-containing protein [Actinomyces sp. 2119]RJF41846.1 NUDIX domain-containing protein [Actinomyces sp. 2119]
MPAISRLSRLVVAAAVVDSLSEPTALLCAARSYPPELAGRFELPGGKVEPGETPTQALVRELAEEVSLTVRLGTELVPPAGRAAAPPCASPAQPSAAAYGDDAPAWPVTAGLRMRVWLAEPADHTDTGTAGTSHQLLEWTALDVVTGLPWLEADVAIIDTLLEELGRLPRRF